MAYIGRPGATAPLTSADIPDNTITASKIVDGAVDFQNELGFLENASGTQNLTGTYSTERMYLNDSYTLTGNVTVTGHLSLGTIADSDVVITQDSTERTITGSGTLEAGRLMSDRQTSLTGMTGELGSGVTLGGGATFPAGHMVFIDSFMISGGSTISASSFTDTGLTITVPAATVAKFSKLVISVRSNMRVEGNGSHCFAYLKFLRSAPSEKLFVYHRFGHHQDGGHDVFGSYAGTFTDDSLGTGDHTYKTVASTQGYSSYIMPLGESDGANNEANEIIVYGVI